MQSVTIVYENNTSRVWRLFVEPWAREIPIKPYSKIEIVGDRLKPDVPITFGLGGDVDDCLLLILDYAGDSLLIRADGKEYVFDYRGFDETPET